jgi:hypothetical protein
MPALAEDPPRRVGSLDYVSGEVVYALHGDAADPGRPSWLAAEFDQPIAEDMSVQTGSLARARIRIGPNAVEIAADSDLDVLNLTDRVVEASLRQGRVFLQIRTLQEGERVEIEIPTGALWLLKPGAYDIDVGTDDRPARVAVFEGTARFADGSTDLRVEAGQEAQITASYPAAVVVGQLPPGAMPAAAEANADQPTAGSEAAVNDTPNTTPDEFLSWAMASEYNPEQPQSVQYVSRQMTGHERLDAYGRWEKRPDFGAVWFPAAVPADWAPYRFGHWASIAPWGWTWIDDQPWGFAPFHFGRWVRIDERWAWVPGRRVEQPVYAPALVAFLENIDEAGATPGDEPPVGWFPLAPGEAYAPWYDAGPRYIESVNVVYPAQYRDPAWREGRERSGELWRAEFANRRFATLVHRDALIYGQPVFHELVHVPPERLERAAVTRGAPRVVPATARIIAGPGGWRNDAPRSIPAVAGPGGLRQVSPHEIAPRATSPGMLHGEPHGNPAVAPQRAWPEHPNPSAAVVRPEAHAFARPEPAGQHVPHELRPPEGYHPATTGPQFGRPEIPHMPPAQQFGRPEVPHVPPGQQFGRPEVPHTPMSASQGMAHQFGRPEAFHTPAPTYNAPTYNAGAHQFGRPEVAQSPAAMPRPGAPQVMRPGAPAVVGRASPGGMARGAPQVAARPAAPAPQKKK